MYFEVLIVDFESESVVEASIGDEVFSGARVVWDKLPREETRWTLDTVGEVARVWTGRRATGTIRIEGQRDGDSGRYELHVGEHAAIHWDAVPPEDQRRILDGLGDILATINGLLEIV